MAKVALAPAGVEPEPAAAIGLLIHDVRNPFFNELARGVEDVANAAGLGMVLCNTDESEDKEARYLSAMEAQLVEGIVVTPVRSSLRYLDLLRARGVPVVLVDRPAESTDQCSVAVNGVRGGQFVGRHLLGLGHERIAFVTASRSIPQAEDRRRGLLDAAIESGLDPAKTVFEIGLPSLSAESGEAAAARVLGLRQKPTAVFCVNDAVALGVLRGLAKAGCRVPDDLAVVGYDDVDHASMLNPPLTSVRQPKYALGDAAAHLLIDELDNSDHVHRQIEYVPELVVRESTDRSAAAE